MRELRPSVLRGLTLSAAVLVVGMLCGSVAPVSAQNGDVLQACVNLESRGPFRGLLRVIGPNQRCFRWEIPVTLALAGAGGGGSYEGGGIKGVLTECTVPTAGSMAYLNGHSFVVFIGEDAAGAVTGAFEMHNVPPGTYDVDLRSPNYSRVISNVEVISGQVKDLGNVDVCFID